MHRHSSGQLPGASRPPHRSSGDARARNSFGANEETSPGAAQAPTSFQNGQPRSDRIVTGPPPFDMARSPPGASNKNTKHVPCKFFKQGACQAGQACPFLHSTDGTIDAAPCKYFAKGNCRFGGKCALAHILPDGRRVQRTNGHMTGGMNGGNLNIGGRVNPPAYQNQDSALANSLLNHQQFQVDPISGQYLYQQPDDTTFQQEFDDRYAMYLNEVGPGSRTGSKYGSPINDPPLPISGVERRLTALDAQLPASFDSNGISHIARYGAVAASVPSMFQMESPPASFPHRVAGQPVDAVKALRTSLLPSTLRNSSQFGPFPPTINTEEASIQQRMHSQQAVQRPRLLSASVPRPVPSDDWDEGFPLEEDHLPLNLHDDILTPQEKMRRLSRPEQELVGYRSSTQNAGGLGIPSANSSKVGSPLASSPSRFSALFARQKQEASNHPTNNIQTSDHPVGTFGHVGSPLRESHIQNAASTSPAGTGPFGDGITARPSPSTRSRAPPGLSPLDRERDQQSSSAFSGLPQNSSATFGMSLISSQLQRTHLSPRNANDPATDSRLQPSTAGMRHVSAPTGLGNSNTSPTGAGSGSRLDRHGGVSSPRISSTRITEEGEGDLGVFSMDDDVSRRGWGGKSPVIAPMGADGNTKPQNLPQSTGTGFGTIGAEKKGLQAAGGPGVDKGVRTAINTTTATANGSSR